MSTKQRSDSATSDANGSSPASLLSERLSAVVREHYESLAKQENAELESLRLEVLQLRGQVSKVNQEVEPSNAISDVRPGQRKVTIQTIDDDMSHLRSATYASTSAWGLSTSATQDNGRLKSATYTSIALSSSGLEGGECPAVKSMATASASSASAGTELATTPGTCVLSKTSSAQSAQHLRSLESNEAEIMDLKKKFYELDPHGKGYIDINNLADHMTQHLHNDSEEKEDQIHRYKVAVHKLNKHIGILAHTSASRHGASKRHIQFPAFRKLLLDDAKILREQFGSDTAQALIEIRETLIHDVIVQQIAKTWRISAKEVDGDNTEKVRSGKIRRLLKALEPMVVVMIILNALMIGISLDYAQDWDGWFVFELFFTCVFLLEISFRMYVDGLADYFFGSDWCWSWFDFLIVCTAVIDKVIALLTALGAASVDSAILNHLLVIRLVRLVRISRLIRNLRLKFFKEFSLMMNGVIAGLRTLFWAIVMLTLFIYVFAVLSRIVVDPENNDFQCNTRLDGSVACSRGAQAMDLYGPIMFGNVGRAMLTIFSCFTDSCIVPDGTPLLWHLWETHGAFLVGGYVLAFLFVSFGVLNLIMAVFVENTLASAQQHDAERQYGEQSSHVRKAVELQILLGKFCKPSKAKKHRSDKSESKGLIGLCKSCCRKVRRKKQVNILEVDHDFFPENLHMRITQDQFEEMLTDLEVQDLLDDLDISCISREQLFDIIDADGNGYLAISEIVDGIMKLRGPADKGDGVATVLMVRQLQKQVSKFEEHMVKHVQKMDKFRAQLTPDYVESI